MSSLGAVVVTFNDASHVEGCLSSICRQTRPPDRIVVVDDGSADGTQDVVQRLGSDIEFAQTDRLGPSSAFNRGVELVGTDIVAPIAGDDECLPDRFARQVDLLHRHGAEVVLGLPEVMDDMGNARSDAFAPEFFLPPGGLTRSLFTLGNFLCAPTATFRRAAYEQLGGYHPGLLQLQDFHLWVRWSWRKMLIANERFVRYRKSSTSVSASRNDQRMHAERIWIYRHFFDEVPDSEICRQFPPEAEVTAWDRDLFLASLYLAHGDRLVRQIGGEILLDVAGTRHGRDRLARAGFTLQDLFAVLGDGDVRADGDRQALLDELVAARLDRAGAPTRRGNAASSDDGSTTNGAWR